MGPREIPIPTLTMDRYEAIVGRKTLDEMGLLAEALKQRYAGPVTIWIVNSTAAGGGVAEMLRSILPYAKGFGVNVRWLVITGNENFFKITKRIHNGIHGLRGDPGLLGVEERLVYEGVMAQNLEAMRQLVKPADVAILHDPQTAGLVGGLKQLGLQVVWRSHIGRDTLDEVVCRSWNFLRPYLEPADAFCFTRAAYAPTWLDPAKVYVIQPSIDVFSTKNQEMDPSLCHAILAHIGVISSSRVGPRLPSLEFKPEGGSKVTITRHADMLHAGPLPNLEDPLIVQVSRWDRLKDMAGVMRGFADHVMDVTSAHLALVGPAVHGVSDDPEAATAYDECQDIWRQLPHFKRCRVQLVCLPMADVEENAAMVNALQRHATVVVQKSLYEGFGLTVTEAMWKGKAIVASAVGGIPDQIQHEVNGLLVKDPSDLDEFGAMLLKMLRSSDFRERVGSRARASAKENFLETRHLAQFARLLLSLR